MFGRETSCGRKYAATHGYGRGCDRYGLPRRYLRLDILENFVGRYRPPRRVEVVERMVAIAGILDSPKRISLLRWLSHPSGIELMGF
jgi:hypothetical protein